MAKVTTKLQVTLPKALADRYAIRPGDEITWEPGGDVIRVIPGGRPARRDPDVRLRLFDEATKRQHRRNRTAKRSTADAPRGWSRADLYDRARAR